jgi:uncharacterized protein GlcG (DUF336 family)
MLKACSLVALVGLGAALAASAQTVEKRTLSLDGARKVIAAATEEAKKNNWNVVIAVVDDGGHVILLERMDGVQIGSIDVAVRKARTSALFRRPTKVFEDAVAGGRNALITLDGALMLEGGLPIIADGKVIGAIGVSGVTSQQDGQIGKAGAAVIE